MNRTIWILGGALVLLLIALIFFLNRGDDSGGATTSVVAAPTTTADGGSTTTIGGATTTAAGGSTTTTVVGETTTTAVEETTTTSSSGNWADEPLVVAGFGALGYWDGSAWVRVNSGDSIPVVGGEEYQIAVKGLTATTTGSGQELLCEPLDNTGVILANEDVLGDWPGPYGVAISAPWDLVPHVVEDIDDDGTYAGFAAELLAERGLIVDDPVIKQLLRVDLEGDGVNEVIVVSEDVAAGLIPVKDDYSIVFMRKVVEGDVETAVLANVIVKDTSTDFPASFWVSSVSDLSGDGKMEIVLSSGYFEGLGVEVFEYVNDDLGPVSQISAGCGS